MTGINEKAPDGAVLHRQFNPLHFGIFIANPYGAKIMVRKSIVLIKTGHIHPNCQMMMWILKTRHDH